MSGLLKTNFVAILFVICISAKAIASVETNSAAGINSVAVPYTGNGINVGQVEFERPGKFGFDNGLNSNFGTIPKGVFLLDDRVAPTANSQAEIFDLSGPGDPNAHATQVAGVIIGKDPYAPGVAQDADLYATAGTFPQIPSIPAADSIAISTQFIATINDDGLPSNDSIDDVRAINMSFLFPYEAGNFANGNSKFTQFVDWSAAKHDVLYVAGGRNDELLGFYGQPLDNFNGITVGTSEKVNGVYRKFGSSNIVPLPDASGRTHIDILAPGHQVEVADAGGNPGLITDGTSIAAPHVTGTVALLQEYGDAQIAAGAPNWTGTVASGPTARRHEVMKAVLMNSADKIEDDGTFVPFGKVNPVPAGNLLGMTRTVLKTNGDDWDDSDAWMDGIPLDEEMGAGHLNAKRALQQFIPGEQEISGTRFDYVEDYTGDVPAIGWDYGTVGDPNIQNNTVWPMNRYLIDEPLEQGNFISITLAWDREVKFANDADMDGEYDIGDTFETYTNLDEQLTDLNLYLAPKGTEFIGEAVMAYSESEMTSVEHIFFEIPFTGEWEIWVFRNEQSAPAQDYGLAWWYGLAPEIEPPELSGDFDSDGDVDGADFLAWQQGFGGAYGASDLTDWEDNFGSTGAAIAAAGAVPEPSSCVMLLMGLIFYPQVLRKIQP